MLPSQAINLVPQPQVEPAKTGRHGTREDKAGTFGDMLNTENTMPETGKVNAQNKPEQTPAVQPEAQEETADIELEQNNNIIPFPLITAFRTAFNQENWPTDKALRLLETVAAILESNQGNVLNIKEIAPLLQELQQVMQEIPPQTEGMENLLTKLTQVLEEVQARMPYNEGIVDSAQQLPDIDKLNQLIGKLRGYLSPLENVSEEAKPPVNTPETEPTQLKPVPTLEHAHKGTAEEDNSPQHNHKNDTSAPTVHTDAQANTMRVDIAPHKVFFAEYVQAAEQTPRFTQLTPESLFDAMVERITALPGAEPHMEISLKPDHLGKISIDLSLGEQGLTAKIIANDEGVRNMLAAHVNRLSETLAEKGIRVENVEIAYSALADKQNNQRQSAQQEQGKNNNYNQPLWGVAENHSTGWDTAYTISPYTDEWGFSSVEYQA